MEGDTMRAKISERARRFGAVRTYTGAGQDATSLEGLSLVEARAILAETAGEWDNGTPVWDLAPWEKRGACYRDMAADLRAFVAE
jgi:hypothetical protein